jgi:IS605 OrfB family transposase
LESGYCKITTAFGRLRYDFRLAEYYQKYATWKVLNAQLKITKNACYLNVQEEQQKKATRAFGSGETVSEGREPSKKLGRWGFAELRSIVEYKATTIGKKVVAIDPRYTSRACSKCGFKKKENRNGRTFKCKSCGFQVDADGIAIIAPGSEMMLKNNIR